MKIQKPAINPKFFYGPIVSYQFIGDISKDKGKYRIRFTLTFKSGDVYTTQKSGFRTEPEARKGKELLITELVRNEYIPFFYTLQEFFDYWLYVYMIEKRKIRYNTFVSYHNVLYKYLLPSIGPNKKLNHVTISDIENAVREIPFSSVRKRGMDLVSQLFDFAFTNHYISFNPCIAAVERVKKCIQKKTARIVVPYTVEEIQNLLYTCRLNFHEMYLPLLLSLVCGVRISELIGLKFSDIDFTSGTVCVRRQLGRDINDDGDENLVTQEMEVKTHNGVRSIPIPTWVHDEILVQRAWYEHQRQFVPDFQDNGYICCHCDGRPFNRSSFGKDFHSLTNMCGLRKIVWHDLRHMYATTLKNNAVNLKAISLFLGHGSENFSADHYIFEEKVFDCAILTEVWEEIRPVNKSEVGTEELFIPLTNEDFASLLC